MQPQTVAPPPGSLPDLRKDIEDIFADPDAWLNTPLIELGGRKPIDLIGTPDEEQVRDLTEAIKHGLYS